MRARRIRARERNSFRSHQRRFLRGSSHTSLALFTFWGSDYLQFNSRSFHVLSLSFRCRQCYLVFCFGLCPRRDDFIVWIGFSADLHAAYRGSCRSSCSAALGAIAGS